MKYLFMILENQINTLLFTFVQKFGGISCTEILLRNGASLLKRDQDGCTPFRLAVGSNQLDIVNLFLSHMFSKRVKLLFLCL